MFHRRQFDNRVTPKAQHQRRVEEVIAGAPEEHRAWLTEKLEHSNEPQSELPRVKAMRERLDQLSPKQRELLEAIRESSSVSQAASDLSVSRSNVYASLRRISRKLGTRSVPELLAILREGDLLERPAP